MAFGTYKVEYTVYKKGKSSTGKTEVEAANLLNAYKLVEQKFDKKTEVVIITKCNGIDTITPVITFELCEEIERRAGRNKA